MLRALRFIKYLPILLVIVLLLAWVVSVFFVVLGRSYAFGNDCLLTLSEGSLHGECSPSLLVGNYMYYCRNRRVAFPEEVLGRFEFRAQPNYDGFQLRFSLPIVTLTTLSLPVAIGALRGYRFRLWHCLGYGSFFAILLSFQSQGEDFPFELNEMGWIGAFLVALSVSCAYLSRKWRERGANEVAGT